MPKNYACTCDIDAFLSYILVLVVSTENRSWKKLFDKSQQCRFLHLHVMQMTAFTFWLFAQISSLNIESFFRNFLIDGNSGAKNSVNIEETLYLIEFFSYNAKVKGKIGLRQRNHSSGKV